MNGARLVFAGIYAAAASVLAAAAFRELVPRPSHRGPPPKVPACYCPECRPELHAVPLPDPGDYPDARDYLRRLRESLTATLAKLDQEQAKLDAEHRDKGPSA